MVFDTYAKSTELLERIANSVYDRNPTNPKPLFFNLSEINLVEEWLIETLNEFRKFSE